MRDEERIEEARPEGDERLYTGEPLEREDGSLDVPAQHNVGEERERGGGEWPDPATPPHPEAPGALDDGDDDPDRSRR